MSDLLEMTCRGLRVTGMEGATFEGKYALLFQISGRYHQRRAKPDCEREVSDAYWQRRPIDAHWIMRVSEPHQMSYPTWRLMTCRGLF